MARATRPRVRRSHILGGCTTCRRRHVKCDQTRPACRTCRDVGIKCEGFSDRIHWMHGDGSEEAEDGPRAARRHLYTEQSRLSMSTALKADLLSGSIDASLSEIDLRSRDADNATKDDVVIGPFGVLKFTSAAEPQVEAGEVVKRAETYEDNTIPSDTATSADSTAAVIPDVLQDTSPVSIFDSLSQMDDFLHWSDLLSFDLGQSRSITHPTLSMPNGISFDLDEDAGLLPLASNITDDPIQASNQDQIPMEIHSAGIDLLQHAQFLLKHFQDVVIPQIMAIPGGMKSPWKILNLPAAVVAFGDSTFLGTNGVSHARLANLYGLLACSALDLALKPHQEMMESNDHWPSVVNQLYQNAKDHMQISLQHETQGPKKAKYKDQLMAANILTQYAILSGQQEHARYYLIDAERLLRLRGLSKSRISKKARLLHHVYTWLRILGESTFVLHDYGLSYSCLENLGSSGRAPIANTITTTTTSNTTTANEANPRLDDFLRLENQSSDNDLNIDEPKDTATGYNDIHLHDSRSFSEHLYKQIYGIPETWLSLLSQTTRLANVLEAFRVARSSGRIVSMDAWEKLQRRSMRLENMICSLHLRGARGRAAEPLPTSRPQACMLEALNEALMVFFYRRIREVHPAVLQGHVDNVINALECGSSLSDDDQMGPGTAWPVFIAGSEALTSPRREAIMQWLNNASSKCGFTNFAIARDLLMKVWYKQDEHLVTNKADPILSWIEVAKEERIWPLFC
ncbi:transcriptional regulator family: Fungal Specific TF [Penicillium angulare]|uniref:transcriptional regulator family: Fungal Specific TF n=1 Tax=Penicillium angulare TaxID=116970 RepID=UPI002541EBA1|nr:transcriptional regulator family: Fungal Specific TF [Penicillium angulare]KAJ5281637.1 transcriptional regulator family: Fungal Specific TF [Penicillium angulare]